MEFSQLTCIALLRLNTAHGV